MSNETPVVEKKNRTVFRNQHNKIFYLKPRPHQAASDANFILGPGQTIEPIDDAEEKLLSDMGLVDVAKETPEIANRVDDLQKQLEEAKALNAKLRAEKEELEKQSEQQKGKSSRR